MKSTYKDSHIQLKDILLTQFEQGREVPALIELLSVRPGGLTIQDRMLMSRIVAAKASRKNEPTTVAIGIEALALMGPILTFMFGTKAKQPLLCFQPRPKCRESEIARELNDMIKDDSIVTSARDIVQRCTGGKDFLIIALEEKDHNEIRAVIDMFNNGRKGLLLIRDYAMVHAASHYEYGRERGFRLLEMVDGSGELVSI
ncbi:MAG: hypothetical protein ACK5AJ_12235 [bacterium]|jgi:hypothetical protein